MKKLILLLTIFLSHVGYTQTCPTAPVQHSKVDSLVARKIKLCGATPGLYKFNSNFHFVPATAGTDYSTPSSLSDSLDGYLKLSGGIMTGAIAAGGQPSVDPAGRFLYYSTGVTSMDFGEGALYSLDGTGFAAFYDASLGFGIQYGGSGIGHFKTSNLTANRTYQLPNISGDLLTQNSTATLTNKTWNGSVIGSSYGGAGTVNGILKANGAGTVSAAVAGTDYQAASSDSISINTGIPISFEYNSYATVSAGGLGTQQGIGFDGTNTYLIYTEKLEKRDGSLALTTSNSTPYTSITGTINHLGDGEVNGSYLYVPAENYINCTVSNIRVVKYLTSDLSFDSESSDLSANVNEASGLTIIGDTIFISSFCTSDTIKKFNKNTFAYIGAITVSYPEAIASGVQGICNDGTNIYLAVNNSEIYKASLSGGAAKLVYSMAYATEIEGTDYYSAQIRWFLKTLDNNSQILKLDKKSYALKTFKSDDIGTENTRDHISYRALKVGLQPDLTFTFNPATSIVSGYWTKILLSASGLSNRTSIGHDHTGTSYFCNGYFDATGSWQTFDNTKVNLLYFQNLSSQRHEWRYSPSGTPSWVTPFYINTNPTLGADLLTATTETYNIGSASSRILNAHVKNGVFSTVVNIGGASAASGTLLNTTTSTTNPQVSLENTGTGGTRFYLFSTNNSNGSGGGKFLIAPTSSSGTNVFCMTSAGRIGINGVTTPTAYFHLPAGLASANGAPFKYTTGTLNTTPETGAKEFDGSNEYLSVSTTRYTLAKTLTNTASLNFDLTSVNYEDLTITVTGAADGDAVSIAVPNASATANVVFTAWTSGANTVTIRASRIDVASGADPASGTFRASVIKY